MTVIRYGLGDSQVGPAFAALTDRGICAIYLLESWNPAASLARLRVERPDATLIPDSAAVAPVFRQLADFLANEARSDPLPLDLSGGTAFQQRVWEALRAIPRGETRTYGELAREIGSDGGARTVGTACGANPIAVLVPCHRAVKARGGLGGYRWGLDRKRAFLELEGAAVLV